MATQKLTIQLGLDGVGRVTGGLQAVAGVAQSTIGSLGRLAGPLIAVGAAAAGLKSIASGLSEVIEDSGRLVDTAKATGVAFERMARLRAVFAEAGSGADQVLPTFAKLEKALFEAAQTGGASAEAFKQMGLNVGDLLNLSPDERLLAVGKALHGIEDSTTRAGLVMEVFGKSGLDLLQIFDALGDTSRTDRALGRLPEVLGRNAEVLDAIGDGFSQLKLKGQQFFAGILDQVAPTLDSIVQGFTAIDLTAAGQKAGAFVRVALDYWEAGRFDEFIGLTIQAGFELGQLGARRTFRALLDWLAGPGLWSGIGNALLTTINSGMKLAGRGAVSVFEMLAQGALRVMDQVAQGMVISINWVAGKLEDVINAEIKAVNTLFGTNLGLVQVGRVDYDEKALSDSTAKIEAAADASKRWLDGFFDQSTQAGRSLMGIAPGGDDLTALNELSGRMREILEAREATARAEKKVADGMKPQVPIANALADLRRLEAEAAGRLTELERQRGMIEGSFRLKDAQKYAQKLALLRQERAEIERIIALLQERAAAPGLTEQEREQILRAVVGELLEYFDGWQRFDTQGRIQAGRWEHHAAPPRFTPATTIDHHDLIEEVALDAEGWRATSSGVVVRFKDRHRAFKDNAVRVASVFNRSVTGDARERSVDRPWITRAEQAAAVAAEVARVSGEPGLSGMLVVRREKCTEIEPGTRFLLTHAALGLAVICRCEGKTIEPPPAMRVTLPYRLEQALAPAGALPPPASWGVPELPAAEVVSLFEFLQPPPHLAGSDSSLLVLAARTSAVTVSMRVHLREADGDLFYEIGQQSQWAVRGELHTDYSASEAVEDNSENLRIDLNPLTVEPDRLSLQETQSADAVNDDAFVVFVLRASNPTHFEILTLKEIRIATGEAFYRLKVRRARFGTSRLAFTTGDRAWLVRRAALVFHRHGSFRAYALSGTTTTFRLQARNLFGREADLADTTQCPNRTFAFGSGGLWVPAAPSGLTVSTTPTDYVLSWSDNSTNEAGFRIEYSTDGTTWTSAGTVGPGVTSASIPGPPYDQTVFWRVIAYNGAGESLGSPTSSGYLPSGA